LVKTGANRIREAFRKKFQQQLFELSQGKTIKEKLDDHLQGECEIKQKRRMTDAMPLAM
jgi:hypothetical protein